MKNTSSSLKRGDLHLICKSHKCVDERRLHKIVAEREDVKIVQCQECGKKREANIGRRVVQATEKTLVKKKSVSSPEIKRVSEMGAHPDMIPVERNESFSVGDVRAFIYKTNRLFERRKFSGTDAEQWNEFQRLLEFEAVNSFGIRGVLFSELTDSIKLNVSGNSLMNRAKEWVDQKRNPK